MSLNDRLLHYKQSGVILITSRILIVDLLKDRIPINNIKTIYVYNAHKLTFKSPDVFVCTLYKEKCKNGIIIGLTDHPDINCGGNILYKLCINLHVQNVLLYPRYHEDIIKCIDEHPTEVVQLRQNMTDLMKEIQNKIIFIIDSYIKNLELTYKTLFNYTNEDYLSNKFLKNFENKSLKFENKSHDKIDYIKTLYALLLYYILYIIEI